MKLKSFLLALAVGTVAVAGTASAAVDTTAASSGFTDVSTAIGTIGPLMLTAASAGIVYKWVVAFLI